MPYPHLGRVVKLRAHDMARIGAVTLMPGQDHPLSGCGGYALPMQLDSSSDSGGGVGGVGGGAQVADTDFIYVGTNTNPGPCPCPFNTC
jgi:hypothetical protein